MTSGGSGRAAARAGSGAARLRRAVTGDPVTLAAAGVASVLVLAALLALVTEGWVAALLLLAQAFTIALLVLLHRRLAGTRRVVNAIHPDSGSARRQSERHLEALRRVLLDAEGRRRLDDAFRAQEQQHQAEGLTAAVTALREDVTALRRAVDGTDRRPPT